MPGDEEGGLEAAPPALLAPFGCLHPRRSRVPASSVPCPRFPEPREEAPFVSLTTIKFLSLFLPRAQQRAGTLREGLGGFGVLRASVSLPSAGLRARGRALGPRPPVGRPVPSPSTGIWSSPGSAAPAAGALPAGGESPAPAHPPGMGLGGQHPGPPPHISGGFASPGATGVGGSPGNRHRGAAPGLREGVCGVGWGLCSESPPRKPGSRPGGPAASSAGGVRAGRPVWGEAAEPRPGRSRPPGRLLPVWGGSIAPFAPSPPRRP